MDHFTPSPLTPLSLRTVMTGITAFLLSSSYRMLPSLISEYAYVDRMGEINTQYYNTLAPEEYDFIVVGAGSAGSLVANRLSRHFRTLLIEQGGIPFPLQSVPAFAPIMIGNADLDSRYYTTAQTYSCMSLANRSSYWPIGKGLGGTSLLNFLAWNRGHPLCYDNWAEITSDDRWSYKELLNFFKRTERYSGNGNSSFHGYKGDISVSPASYKPLVKYFLGAAQELGYPIGDLNAPYDEIFNEHSFNHYNGERQSSYHAFIRPIEEDWRFSLTIRKWAYVTKVLIQHQKPRRAYGIQYAQGGRLLTAIASKEIILSAGAIGSPKLLMLSGVGPAEHLKSVGIKPLVDLPVGLNLVDHVATLLPFEMTPTSGQRLTYIPARDSSPMNIIEYLSSGRGPLGQSGSMASGFLQLDKQNESSRTWPDTQLLLIGLPLDPDGLDVLIKMSNLEPSIARKFYSPIVNKDSFSIMTVVSRPKSRGLIQLASSDPFDKPLIDPNYLSEPEDMKIMLKAINKTLELVENTKAFSYISAKLMNNPFPSCRQHPYRSTEYWECFAREFTISVYHPCGTCAMGKDSAASVVDSSLKVKGVTGLRVIDASVMPNIVSSNINPACTVIAERGAQMILDDYLKRP